MKRALEQQQRELAEKRKQFDEDKRLFDEEHQKYMEELEASMRLDSLPSLFTSWCVYVIHPPSFPPSSSSPSLLPPPPLPPSFPLLLSLPPSYRAPKDAHKKDKHKKK